MIDLVRYLVIAAAGATALGIIAAEIAPQWRRIVKLASGRSEVTTRSEHWRRVHLAADRRDAIRSDG